MAPLTYVASTVLSGLVVVLVVALARSREWRSAAASPGGVAAERANTATTLAATARSPLGWTVAFLALVLGIGGGALAFVTGSIPTAVSRVAGVALVLAAAAVMGGYLFWGVYHAARYRGVKSAGATGAGLWVLGTLLVLVIVVKLVMV